MTARKRLGPGPLIAAFTIWFAHFMVVWAAGEIWPHQRAANVLAWGATGVALLAVGGYHARLKQQHAAGLLSNWSYRFARRATAVAAVAVLFSAMPSVFFL